MTEKEGRSHQDEFGMVELDKPFNPNYISIDILRLHGRITNTLRRGRLRTVSDLKNALNQKGGIPGLGPIGRMRINEALTKLHDPNETTWEPMYQRRFREERIASDLESERNWEQIVRGNQHKRGEI